MSPETTKLSNVVNFIDQENRKIISSKFFILPQNIVHFIGKSFHSLPPLFARLNKC
jgi:hypothetical protein